MMRWIDRGILGMAVLMCISSAFAQGDPMSIYYDNTLVCRSAAMQCHFWFKSDGTYRQYVMKATPEGTFGLSGVEGRFTVSAKNGSNETCLIPEQTGGPMGGRATECYALAGHTIGDAWTATANGTAIEFSLRAGRQVNTATGLPDPIYTAPAAADSGCKSYDVSDIINSIDFNKDGKMTQEEWTKARAPASAFQMLDRDKKGYVTPSQITANGPPPGMDTNHDCKITLAEMKAMDGKTPMPAGPPPK